MGVKSNLLIQATKYNNKRIVRFTLGLFNVLDKLFSSVKKKESLHNKEDNQHLNDALVSAVENLNYDIVELLVNAGANVNSLDKNNKNAITHAIERLAASRGLPEDSLENLPEGSLKNLPEEIISHSIVQFLLVRGSEYPDNINVEKKHTPPIKENAGRSLQSEPIYEEIPTKSAGTLSGDEPIYAEIDDFGGDDLFSNGYSSIKELKAQRKSVDLSHIYAPVNLAAKQGVKELDDEPIYEEIDHFRKNNSSFDSGYSSIEECSIQQEPIYAEISDDREHENPLYVSVEECKTQKESIDSSKQEPIYAKVDFAAKRSERKAKSIKADSNTYHGLVKDRKNQWEKKINNSEADTARGQKGELRTNTRKTISVNVERIKQKYESGYDSGYESDTKMEQLRIKYGLPKTPNSKVNSVHVEHRIVGLSI